MRVYCGCCSAHSPPCWVLHHRGCEECVPSQPLPTRPNLPVYPKAALEAVRHSALQRRCGHHFRLRSPPALRQPPLPPISPLCLSRGLYLSPRAAASVVLTGVFLQQPLLSTPKVHLWVVLWEPRHAEVPVCSAPGLCSPPAKGEWAADAEHSRSSTAEPLAARC